jgi:hypothetical protein
MAKIQITILFLLVCLTASAQRYEKVRFGDFEHWTVRYVEESQVIGGQVKTLYVIGPTDTIRSNDPYKYKNTIWATSNALAKVMGVVKTSNNVEPDKGPTGTCAKLSTQFASCKVVGLFSIKVLAGGSIYWGKMLEPVTGVKDPFAFMDWGVKFTKRPKALVLNYKAEIPNTGKLVKGTTFRTTEFNGYDPAEILFVLQYRWEDDKGNIHAKRVGTAVYHIENSTNGWVMNSRIPVIYGDARKSSDYKPYMDLISGDKTMYAINAKGKKKVIQEEGWADADSPITHAIMMINSSSQGAFVGAVGNILWVDEIRLEY